MEVVEAHSAVAAEAEVEDSLAEAEVEVHNILSASILPREQAALEGMQMVQMQEVPERQISAGGAAMAFGVIAVAHHLFNKHIKAILG